MHMLYDVETQVPAFVYITTANVHDTKVMPDNVVQTTEFLLCNAVAGDAYADFTGTHYPSKRKSVGFSY